MMKGIIFISLIILASLSLTSQNIGINNTDPKLSLDINGGIAHRSITLTPFLNNVVVPDDASFVVISNVDVTGPVTIYFDGDYIDGRRLIIQNLSTHSATLFGSNHTIGHNETMEFICKNPGGFYQINEVNLNSGWNLTGNNGTNPTQNYLGTNDDNDMVFKTNGNEKMRLLSTSSHTELQLKSSLEDTSNTLLFVNRNTANEGIDFAISRFQNDYAEFGLNFSSKSNYPLFSHENLLYLSALSGYVGIGTNSPFGKLTIGGHRSLGSNLPTLMLIDSSLTNENGSSIQFRNLTGSNNYQITSHMGNQSTGEDSYLTFSKNSIYHMRLRGDGNLGLGIINPTSKLDVNGDVAISGNNRLELGKNIDGKEANAGTIAYQRFSDALDIVGAGENSDLTDRKVKIWAEGGTELNGSAQINGSTQINGYTDINGTLKIQGNAGTSGQVLVSNGPTAPPSWQSPPMPNNVRFDFGAQNSFGPQTGTFNWTYTSFNTNPSAVYLSGGEIYFAESGLYRLEIEVNADVLLDNPYNGIPPKIIMNCDFDGTAGLGAYGIHSLFDEPLLVSYPGTTTYHRKVPFRGDYYIAAGTSLNFTYAYEHSPSPITNYYTYIDCRGYRID